MSKEFIELVSKMREAQRGYFKTSHGSHEKQEYLKESKRLESAVDKWIKEYKEPGLFSVPNINPPDREIGKYSQHVGRVNRGLN